MSPARINRQHGKGKPARTTFAVKPVTLPTFSFYGHLPVVFENGRLLIGRRPIPIASDAAGLGLIAVIHHARRMLERAR
jgi:hypothetical protein